MTLDEIRELLREYRYDLISASHDMAGPEAQRVADASEAALLKAVEEVVGRAEAAEELLRFGKAVSPSMLDSVSDRDARVLSAWAAVRQREADQAKKARNEAESTLSTLRAERDRLAAESRHSTLRSMAVVGALMARGPGVVTLGAQQLADALLPRIESRPGGGVRLVLGTTTLGEEMDRMDEEMEPQSTEPPEIRLVIHPPQPEVLARICTERGLDALAVVQAVTEWLGTQVVEHDASSPRAESEGPNENVQVSCRKCGSEWTTSRGALPAFRCLNCGASVAANLTVIAPTSPSEDDKETDRNG